MAIIVSCRWLSAFFNVGVALIASSDARCGRSINFGINVYVVYMSGCQIKLFCNRRPRCLLGRDLGVDIRSGGGDSHWA
jgi:hypothetical protein